MHDLRFLSQVADSPLEGLKPRVSALRQLTQIHRSASLTSPDHLSPVVDPPQEGSTALGEAGER